MFRGNDNLYQFRPNGLDRLVRAELFFYLYTYITRFESKGGYMYNVIFLREKYSIRQCG